MSGFVSENSVCKWPHEYDFLRALNSTRSSEPQQCARRLRKTAFPGGSGVVQINKSSIRHLNWPAKGHARARSIILWG